MRTSRTGRLQSTSRPATRRLVGGRTTASSTASGPPVAPDSTTSGPTSMGSPRNPASRREGSATAESPHTVRRTISSASATTWQNDSQSTTSSRTSAAESTSNARGSRGFWSDLSKETSLKWWLPIKTGSAASPLNSYTGSFRPMASTSWFSIKRWKTQSRSSPRTCSPSPTYSPVESMERGNTAAGLKIRRIRIRVGDQDVPILKSWMGTCRALHNQLVEKLNNREIPEGKKTNFIWLRNRFVIAVNKNVEKRMLWTLQTPKHVREAVVKEFATNVKTRLSARERFRMRFRSRKQGESTILIPKAAIKNLDNEQLRLYPKMLQRAVLTTRKTIPVEHDCRLQMDGLGRFFLLVPVKSEVLCHREPRWQDSFSGPRSQNVFKPYIHQLRSSLSRYVTEGWVIYTPSSCRSTG